MRLNAEIAKCYVKKEDGSGYRKYRGRLINILNLIRDEYTHAKVVQKGSKEYKERSLSYILTNDNRPETFLLRV